MAGEIFGCIQSKGAPCHKTPVGCDSVGKIRNAIGLQWVRPYLSLTNKQLQPLYDIHLHIFLEDTLNINNILNIQHIVEKVLDFHLLTHFLNI